MKQCRAASDVCERHAPSRSWGGFGKPAPLLTSTSVRLSIQFLHGNTPSAALAVWACIVPHGTMLHSQYGHASFRTVLCNTQFFWDAKAGYVSNNAHTPPCRASLPGRSSAKFRRLPTTPTAFLPSSMTTDRRPTSSTSGSPVITRFRSHLRRPSSRSTWFFGRSNFYRPILGRYTPPRRPLLRSRDLRHRWSTKHPARGLC